MLFVLRNERTGKTPNSIILSNSILLYSSSSCFYAEFTALIFCPRLFFLHNFARAGKFISETFERKKKKKTGFIQLFTNFVHRVPNTQTSGNPIYKCPFWIKYYKFPGLISIWFNLLRGFLSFSCAQKLSVHNECRSSPSCLHSLHLFSYILNKLEFHMNMWIIIFKGLWRGN